MNSPEDPETHLDKKNQLIKRETVKTFLKLMMDNLFHIKIENIENIPKKGAAILVCNHTDNMDALVQAAYLPRKMLFLAKKELTDIKEKASAFFLQKNSPLHYPSLQFLVPHIEKNLTNLSEWLRAQCVELGSHPIERDYYTKVSPRKALEYYEEIEEKLHSFLQDGDLVSIFPEGTRTRTGLVAPFKSAAAKLAIRAQVPIIPSGISGTWKFSTIESFLTGRAFRNPIYYKIGKAILPKDFPKGNNKKATKDLNAIVEEQVRVLSTPNMLEST